VEKHPALTGAGSRLNRRYIHRFRNSFLDMASTTRSRPAYMIPQTAAVRM
jgi:hypothetical protein